MLKRLTGPKTKESITSSNPKVVNALIRPIFDIDNKARSILTGTKIKTRNTYHSYDAFLTSPNSDEREENIHLSDSWQTNNKRLRLWFKNQMDFENRDKEKHTQLARANYYKFD